MTGTKRSLSGENEVSECKRPCNTGNNVQSPQVNIVDFRVEKCTAEVEPFDLFWGPVLVIVLFRQI